MKILMNEDFIEEKNLFEKTKLENQEKKIWVNTQNSEQQQQQQQQQQRRIAQEKIVESNLQKYLWTTDDGRRDPSRSYWRSVYDRSMDELRSIIISSYKKTFYSFTDSNTYNPYFYQNRYFIRPRYRPQLEPISVTSTTTNIYPNDPVSIIEREYATYRTHNNIANIWLSVIGNGFTIVVDKDSGSWTAYFYFQLKKDSNGNRIIPTVNNKAYCTYSSYHKKSMPSYYIYYDYSSKTFKFDAGIGLENATKK